MADENKKIDFHPVDETLDDLELEALEGDTPDPLENAGGDSDTSDNVEIETEAKTENSKVIENLLAGMPTVLLQKVWTNRKLGDLTPQEKEILHAANLEAIQSYNLPDFPQWVQDLIKPWEGVLVLMFILTKARSEQVRAENAKDVTPDVQVTVQDAV